MVESKALSLGLLLGLAGPICLISAGLVMTGCDSGAGGAAPSEGVQRFLVGPQPQDMKGQDLRFRLLVPRAYLPPKYWPDARSEAATSMVPFIAHLADFSAAGDLSPASPGMVVGTVGWAPEGYVRSRVDGSSLNTWSRYSKAGGTRFGLEMRTPPEHRYVPTELYVSLEPGQQVAIECAYLPADRPQYCQASSQRPGKPLVKLWFREDDLPGWRAMTKRAHQLVAIWAAVEP